MKLFYKKTGEGKPLIILHGLFGLSDNWATLSKTFSEKGFCCYLIDQRNHGKSPHSENFTYELMAEDLLELMNDEKINTAEIIGHSMGGKTAMFFALKHSDRIRKMIIADMSPKYYAPHHQVIFAALKSIDILNLTSRKEAEEKLRNALSDEATIQFLLKNLYWREDKRLAWRFGFLEIEKNVEEIGKALTADSVINIPVLFLRGERSGYITKSDEIEIKRIFPLAEIKTVPDAGHWIHAENPGGFMEMVLEYLK